MASILVVGGGMAGQTAAMLLAKDGHSVTVLERDPESPPASVDEAWAHWERRGVNQFRMLHYFLPRFRDILERELPEVVAAMDENGALRYNPIVEMPAEFSGGVRHGDERFESLTGRRPVMEGAVARIAASTPGVEVRRGVAVRGLLTDSAANGASPHVTGVVTEDGDELRADLVVDAAGRRSALPRWLVDIGARPPLEELDDCGFVYYGRHFHSDDGSVPPAFGGLLQPYESTSILTLPADNGTWGVGLVVNAHDEALRAARHVDVWERVVRSYPLVAHWLDGEPFGDVEVMAKIEDRHRTFVINGDPVVTGVVALGDSWACTNPSVGRGATIAILHACALRDVLRANPVDDRVGFVRAWHDETLTVVEPLYRDTLAFDRHRLGQIDAQIAGVPYETDDPGWLLSEALAAATVKSPDALRDFLDVISLYARGVDVLARPGAAERAIELGSNAEPPPGPSREELLAIVGT